MNSIPFYGYDMIYSLTSDGQLGCFQFGSTMSKALRSMHVQDFCGYMFSFLLVEYL